MIVSTKFIFLTILYFVSKAFAALNDEISSESIEFKLYMLESDEWTEDGNTIKFQDILVSESNKLCSAKPSDCGLTEWNETFSFMRSHVVIADGYPKIAVSDLEVRFYILYPGNSSLLSSTSQQFVLNSMAAESVLLASKDKLEEALETYITYINEKFYGIPPDTKTNKIIIPIAFVVLAVVAITALALSYWSKKKEKQRNKMSMKKKHFSTKETTNHFSTKTPNQRQVDKQVTNHHQDTEYNLMRSESLDNKQTADHKQMPNTGTEQDGAILNEVKARHNELPPLATEATEEREEDGNTEKRKKRKSKRKRKHREREAYENSALETSDNEIKNARVVDIQPNNAEHVEETMM